MLVPLICCVGSLPAASSARALDRLPTGAEMTAYVTSAWPVDFAKRFVRLEGRSAEELPVLEGVNAVEPPRVCRRPWVVSYAAISMVSAAA